MGDVYTLVVLFTEYEFADFKDYKQLPLGLAMPAIWTPRGRGLRAGRAHKAATVAAETSPDMSSLTK